MSDTNDQPMTTGDWFFTLLLLALPIVNIICFIVWLIGFGNRNRVSYCRASLLFFLIGLIIYALLVS